MTFIINYWAKAAGISAVLIVFFTVSAGDFEKNSVQIIALVNLALLMLHQFEEYVYPGRFKEFFNTHVMGKIRIIRFPLSDLGIIMVNIILGWGLYILGVLIPHPVFVTVLLISSLLNGVTHTVALIKFKKYNPGFISGLFVFIPFSVFSIMFMANNSLISAAEIYMAIPFAFLGIALIPVTLYLCRKSK